MLTKNILNLFKHANRYFTIKTTRSYQRKQYSLDSDYFNNHPIDEQTVQEIKQCNSARKTKANIDVARDLLSKYEKESDLNRKIEIKEEIIKEIRKFPNKTHPVVLGYEDTTKNHEISSFGEKPKFDGFQSKEFDELTKILRVSRTSQLGNFTSSGSYYLMSDLAEMEQALIRYTTDYLFKQNFELISVPDLLPAEIIEGCGMPPVAENNQVYTLQPGEKCLSGTSEMALGGYFSGKTFKLEELPKKVMAVSRCFRAEAGRTQLEKGIYRVHNFTKVEMFAICLPSQSEDVLENFRAIEIDLFKNLGLHFKVYDMPISELGAPAYRKYDIEAWMPSMNAYGEISSTSNCTDYQSKRLNIYVDNNNNEKIHAHTVNGTACAIPRMLISILEQNQMARSVKIPEALQQYMGRKEIVISKGVPGLILLKKVKV